MIRRDSRTISLESLVTLSDEACSRSHNTEVNVSALLRRQQSAKSQFFLPDVGFVDHGSKMEAKKREGSLEKAIAHGLDSIFNVRKKWMHRRDKVSRCITFPQLPKMLSLIVRTVDVNNSKQEIIETLPINGAQNLLEVSTPILERYETSPSSFRFFHFDNHEEILSDTPASLLAGNIIVAEMDCQLPEVNEDTDVASAERKSEKRNSISGEDASGCSSSSTDIRYERSPPIHPPQPTGTMNNSSPIPESLSNSSLSPVPIRSRPLLPMGTTLNMERQRPNSSWELYSSRRVPDSPSPITPRPALPTVLETSTGNQSSSTAATKTLSLSLKSPFSEDVRLPQRQYSSETASLSHKHNSKSTQIRNPQKEKVEQLTERLVHLSRLFSDLEPSEKDILFIEQSWEEIVHNATSLPPMSQKHQAAIWELLATESAFIRSLRTIQNVFHNTFQDVQQEFFPELQNTRIFSNLAEVLEANKLLWKRYLHPCLRATRLQGQPLKASLMKQGFLLISELFKPYTKFCMEMSGCRRYIQNQERQNPCFSAFLQWGGGIQTSCRLSLCDQLVHPFQRLTKYKLLLERIREYSTEAMEIVDLDDMVRAVSDFVHQVNEDIHRHELWEKLEAIDHRIEGYEAVELPSEEYGVLVKRFSNFRLKSPMIIGFRQLCFSSSTKPEFIRHVLHQGSLRLKEGVNKSIEVYCYLFTDLMLITKPSKKSSTKQKICKPPIRLDRLYFRKINENTFALIVINDFRCATAVYGITTDPRVVNEWLDALNKARKSYLHLMRECDALIASPSIPFADEYESDQSSVVFEENLEENSSMDASSSRMSSELSLRQLLPTVQVIRSSPNIEERVVFGPVNGSYLEDECEPGELLCRSALPQKQNLSVTDVGVTLRPISARHVPSVSMSGNHSHFHPHELSPPPQRPRSISDLRCLLSPSVTHLNPAQAPPPETSSAPSTKVVVDHDSQTCPQSKSTFFVPLPTEHLDQLVNDPPSTQPAAPNVFIENCKTEPGPRRSRSRTPRRQDPRFHTDPTPTMSPNKCTGDVMDGISMFPNKRLSPAFSSANTNCMLQCGELDRGAPSSENHPRRSLLSKEQRFSFDSSSGISSIGSIQTHSEGEAAELHPLPASNVQVFIHQPPSSNSLEKLSYGHLELDAAKMLVGGANVAMRPQELSLPISGSPTVSASNLSQRSALSQDDEEDSPMEDPDPKPQESIGTQTSPTNHNRLIPHNSFLSHLIAGSSFTHEPPRSPRRNSTSLSDLALIQ